MKARCLFLTTLVLLALALMGCTTGDPTPPPTATPKTAEINPYAPTWGSLDCQMCTLLCQMSTTEYEYISCVNGCQGDGHCPW